MAGGEKQWRGRLGTSSQHQVAGSTLVVGSNWGALYGHDLKTGAVFGGAAYNFTVGNTNNIREIKALNNTGYAGNEGAPALELPGRLLIGRSGPPSSQSSF